MADRLSEALRLLAHDDAPTSSPSVEARLKAEFRAMHAARTASPRRSRAAVLVGAAMAAAIVIGVSLPVWRVLRSGLPGGASRPPKTEIATEFLPLPYSAIPTAEIRIVRLELPRSAMASFGLIPPETPGTIDERSATVTADVAIGEDGLARAVRFVRKPRMMD